MSKTKTNDQTTNQLIQAESGVFLEKGWRGFVKHPIAWSKENLNFAFWQRFAKAMLAVVAAMPAAGILISVGRLFDQNFWIAFDVIVPMWIDTLGMIMEQLGWVIIGNLGFLFALAIAGSWTNEKAGGVFTAAMMYLAFHASVLWCSYLFYGSLDSTFGWFYYSMDPVTGEMVKSATGSLTGNLDATVLGITSMQGTQIISGIILGFSGAHVYNKYHTFDKLPKVLAFFNGKRFVPLAGTFYALGWAFIFGITWPWIGTAFTTMGIWLATSGGFFYAPFIYGSLERLLLPFGLHHMITMPMNYGVAGGTYVSLESMLDWGGSVTNAAVYGQEGLWLAWTNDVMWIENSLGIKNWNSLTTVELYNEVATSDWWGNNTYNNITFAQWSANVHAGLQTVGLQGATEYDSVIWILNQFQTTTPARFKVGQVVGSTFILPAMAVAMWLAIPKENRNKTAPLYLSAAATVAICGITEPVEFMFAFTAPLMWVGYSFFMGLVWGFVDVVAAWGFNMRIHAFGMIDFIAKSPVFFVTTLWVDWVTFWVYGIIWGIIAFGITYAYVKWAQPLIPGNGGTNILDDDESMDVAQQGSVFKKDQKLGDNEKVDTIIKALGGKENIKTVDACMTRLRTEVWSADKFNKQLMLTTKPVGVITKGNAQQSIFGGEADVLRSKVIQKLESEGWKPNVRMEVKQVTKEVKQPTKEVKTETSTKKSSSTKKTSSKTKSKKK